MAKRTITFDGYEEPTWEEYTGEDPPIGKWFPAKAVKAKYLEEDDQLQIIFEVTEGDYAGWGRGMYLPLDQENSRYWVTQSTIKAVQGGVTRDLSVDFENQKALDAWVAKMKPVKVKTGEYKDRIRIDKVAAMLEGLPGGKATPAKAAKAAATSAPEPEPEEDAGEDFEDYTEAELNEMEIAELEEILQKEFEEELPKKPRRGGDAKYKEVVIDAILEAQEGDEDDEDESDAEDDSDEFEDGFDEGEAEAEEPEPEPEPEPAPRARRSRAAAPAKAAPAKATTSTRRRRG
jgi:hypothetical protein